MECHASSTKDNENILHFIKNNYEGGFSEFIL